MADNHYRVDDEIRTDEDIAAQMEALDRLTAWDFGEELAAGEWVESLNEVESEINQFRHGLLDRAHTQLHGWHRPGDRPVPSGVALLRSGRKLAAGWALLACGLASFFCGATLLSWSLFGNRPDLWTMGVPITLAGQVGLLLGVVLALDRLGQQNRQTVDRLGRLDERLDELRTAAWLNGPKTPPAAKAEKKRDLFS